uniref:Uncharacterized protein n=1 Tax=Peronospora matthiolae TaxID=2874970 RepID=A0AAV1UQB5_9STRA
MDEKRCRNGFKSVFSLDVKWVAVDMVLTLAHCGKHSATAKLDVQFQDDDEHRTTTRVFLKKAAKNELLSRSVGSATLLRIAPRHLITHDSPRRWKHGACL